MFKRKGDLRGKIQLTFVEKELFDTVDGEFHLVGTEGSVRVRTRPRDRTTYLCQLLDEITGAEIARKSAPRGGAVDPIKPG